METPTPTETTDPAQLATAALALVREHAAETSLLSIAARPVADHPEYQQVNRIGRDGAVLKRGWTFLVNTARHAGLAQQRTMCPEVVRVVGVSRPDDVPVADAVEQQRPTADSSSDED
jgi:hypothetical protein